jgi:pimeloyl-ACP methyl ester carboxylesterase
MLMATSPNSRARSPQRAAKKSPTDHSTPDMAPPSLGLLAMEFRAFWEFGALIPFWPLLQQAKSGDGHSVLVFPGLASGDGATIPLRRYLDSLGYETQGWSQGINYGPRAGVLTNNKAQLKDAFAKSGRKVSLIGWSLGGIYARELAKELPHMVRSVITLGTPFSGTPKSTNAWRVYELTSGRTIEREADNFNLPEAPPVPTTSVFSRTDGIVAWQGSLQAPCPRNPHTENIEVIASHVGMGLNPSAWWAVADRLGQPEGRWTAFDRGGLYGLKGMVYPDPHR